MATLTSAYPNRLRRQASQLVDGRVPYRPRPAALFGHSPRSPPAGRRRAHLALLADVFRRRRRGPTGKYSDFAAALSLKLCGCAFGEHGHLHSGDRRQLKCGRSPCPARRSPLGRDQDFSVYSGSIWRCDASTAIQRASSNVLTRPQGNPRNDDRKRRRLRENKTRFWPVPLGHEKSRVRWN